MARNAGVSEEEIAALHDWRDAGLFSAQEIAALRLMDEILEMSVQDQTIEDLKALFSDGEIVELVMTASFYAMVPRLLDALGVPLDPPDATLEAPASPREPAK